MILVDVSAGFTLHQYIYSTFRALCVYIENMYTNKQTLQHLYLKVNSKIGQVSGHLVRGIYNHSTARAEYAKQSA